MCQDVIVIVDGRKRSIRPGTYSFTDLISGLGSNRDTTKLILVSQKIMRAATIRGNDSYQITGGETFTTNPK